MLPSDEIVKSQLADVREKLREEKQGETESFRPEVSEAAGAGDTGREEEEEGEEAKETPATETAHDGAYICLGERVGADVGRWWVG